MNRRKRGRLNGHIAPGKPALYSVLAFLLFAALAACSSPAPMPSPTAIPLATPTPVITRTATVAPTPRPPVLEPAAKLARNCEQYQSFVARPMVPGQLATDFTLKDTKGKDYTLSNLLAAKPVIMIFGSFTSPQFRQQAAANNDLYKKYGDAVTFITIYAKEERPAGDNPAQFSRDVKGTPITQPASYKERVANAAKTAAEAKVNMPLLVDEIDNPLWCTYGRMPNGAFLIGTDGIILARQDRNDPHSLELAIRNNLGIWR